MHYIKHILYYRRRFDLMQLWELLPQSLMLDLKSTEWQLEREDGYKLEGTNIKLVSTAQPRFHHISVPVASDLNGEGVTWPFIVEQNTHWPKMAAAGPRAALGPWVHRSAIMCVSCKWLPPCRSSRRISAVAHPDGKHTGKGTLTRCKWPRHGCVINHPQTQWCETTICYAHVFSESGIQRQHSCHSSSEAGRLGPSVACSLRCLVGDAGWRLGAQLPSMQGVSLFGLLHRTVPGFQGQTSEIAPSESHYLYDLARKSYRIMSAILSWLEQTPGSLHFTGEKHRCHPSGEMRQCVVIRDYGNRCIRAAIFGNATCHNDVGE